MITYNEALKIVSENSYILENERISINESLDRVLAEDIYSDINMPPFNKSAMDGYACRNSDLKNPLEIIEIIPAGKIPEKHVGPDQCSKIMTGAVVPEGADCVIKIENTRLAEDGRVVIVKGSTEKNICYLGEDVRNGEKITDKFTIITPVHVALLSALGVTFPMVIKLPSAGIICTGNELVEPDQNPGISQIRNSNANQIIAQVKNLGALTRYYGIIEDTRESIVNIIEKAASENDLIIITGGVSVGEFDYVPAALSQAGFKIIFDSIAMQPGKPTKFAIRGKKLCFGLPGNPVSCLLQFELLIKPVIKKMKGEFYQPKILKLRSDSDYCRINTEREIFLPVRLCDENSFELVNYHGSAHISSYLGVHGIISLAAGKPNLNNGEIVDVRQI